ncbi:MAG TPA: hypothetical protein VKV40_01785 [Ktedonobacteraceae bacterium]|nr:hypothetical protein [Ktedonobacteraceae bacterium]
MPKPETEATQMPHDEQAQGNNEPGSNEPDDIQFGPDLLSLCSMLYDCIRVSDARTWQFRKVVGDAYVQISDWLWAHGIMPSYDHEQQRYVIGKRLPLSQDSVKA